MKPANIRQPSYPTTKDRFTYSGRTLAALDVAGVALAIGKSESNERGNGEDTSEHS